jgi:hypothetical protein
LLTASMLVGRGKGAILLLKLFISRDGISLFSNLFSKIVYSSRESPPPELFEEAHLKSDRLFNYYLRFTSGVAASYYTS